MDGMICKHSTRTKNPHRSADSSKKRKARSKPTVYRIVVHKIFNQTVDRHIPPAEDSPKHILHALNNDCFGGIFRNLENIEDFLSVAEVCVKFQENAIAFMPQNLKDFKINKSDSRLSLDRVPNFISTFGHLLNSVELEVFKNGTFVDPHMINMIADSCGEALKSLQIHGHYNVDINTESSFNALDKLEVFGGNFHNFNLESPLRSLKLTNVYMDGSEWLARKFPQLEETELKFVRGLTDNVLIKFIRLNPQLQRLKLFISDLNQSILECIVHYSPELKHLSIEVDSRELELTVLSELRQLKGLHIVCYVDGISVRTLIDKIAENAVPLEDLTINLVDSDCIDSLTRLNLIKLEMRTLIFDDMVMDIVDNMPMLESLMVSSYCVTFGGVMQVLRRSQNVRHIVFGNILFKLDFWKYCSILHVARERDLTVEIVTYQNRFFILEDLPDDNQKWLRISIQD